VSADVQNATGHTGIDGGLAQSETNTQPPEQRSSTPTSKVAPRQRDASVDVARGIAIIGVVFAHVERGLSAAHLGHGAWIPAVDLVLDLYVFGVFAFLGGVFVPKSVNKRSVRTYVTERVFQFSVVYLIWTALQGSVLLLAAKMVNNPGSISSVLKVWAPTGQLWYLPFLVIVTVIFVPLRPWLPERAPWVLGFAALVSIAFWGLDGGIIGTQGLGVIAFFVGGMCVGVDRLQSILRSIPSAVAWVGGVGVFTVGVLISLYVPLTGQTYGWPGRTVSTVVVGVVLCVAMSAAVLLFARAARSWAFVALCGRRSLDIFLVHILLASGSRIILVKLGVHSMWLLVPICFLVGLLGSLLVATALRRIGLAWLFDGPKLPTGGRKRGRRSRAG